MSDPGSIRYSVGGGLLTVANGVLVFVAPSGPLAEEWGELALAPANEAELRGALDMELPVDHHVGLLQLHDGGLALLSTPGEDRLVGRVRRSSEGRIRFGMAPAAASPFWVESGAVGASGFEAVGFEISAGLVDGVPAEAEVANAPSEPEIAPDPAEPREAPGLMIDDEMTVVDFPVPEPPVVDPTGSDPAPPAPAPLDPPTQTPPPPTALPPSAPPGRLDLPPPPEATVLDPPVLSTSLFPDLPTESPAPPPPPVEPVGAEFVEGDALPANPVIERAPTPPPPGTPAVAVSESPPSQSVSLVFDDGQNIPLTSTMAVGRAPEGSEHAPPGAVIVVVAGDQVSRCHFVIRPSEGGAEVVDTNSLNGCFVDYPDRPGTGPQIPVGVPVPIEPGQQLRFGDRSLKVVARGH